MRNVIFITGALILLGLPSCKKNEIHQPFIKDAGPAEQIMNPEVKSLPGAATIYYGLPKGSDILYVEANYVIKKDKKMVVKSSYYDHSITVEGFADTMVHEVKLFSVNRSEKKSDPIIVKVKPLRAPVWNVFDSLTITSDFGGVSVSFKNIDSGSMAISLIVKDSLGEWKDADTYYSSRNEGDFQVRGYKSEEQEFGVYVRDRWNNYSDTLIETLKPLHEEELDKSKFSSFRLDNDALAFGGGWPGANPISNLWNNNLNDYFYATNVPAYGGVQPGVPVSFTINLGHKVTLSRYTVWMMTNEYYRWDTAKEWEVWGSNNPSSDGDWNKWTYIMKNEQIKPSGLPQGTNSAEDIAKAKEGDSFNFPVGTPQYQYLRFKILKSWDGNLIYIAAEMTFWGQH